MDETRAAQGAKRAVDGQWRVFYDGYWIKAYDAPADTLLTKKKLIEALTRRLFNHVEHGVNIPGTRLDEARRAYELEGEPRRRRVKAAMLAGALFNRAADVFTKIVELQAMGVEIRADNELMQQCGGHLQEALELGRQVLHRSGEEGIDELWGEPFKAFAYPIEEFYKSRYAKIAHTMRAIDRIATTLADVLASRATFAGIAPLVEAFAAAARRKCETLHTDPGIFNVWAAFVAAGEELAAFEAGAGEAESLDTEVGLALVRQARDVIFMITRARVPMPKTTRALLERLETYGAGARPAPAPAPPADPHRRLLDHPRAEIPTAGLRIDR
jgi:hypothetical protein